MHELVMAQQVVRAVLSEMDRRGASAVRAIDLAVGELEGLQPDALRRAFELEAATTRLDGAVLRVTVVSAKAFCPACGTPKPFEAPPGHFESLPPIHCPDCGAEMDLEGGRGFLVRSATMVLEDP